MMMVGVVIPMLMMGSFLHAVDCFPGSFLISGICLACRSFSPLVTGKVKLATV